MWGYGVKALHTNTKSTMTKSMVRKERVEVMLDPDYKKRFHKSCIDYGTNMSAVMMDAIKNFVESHPPLQEKPTTLL